MKKNEASFTTKFSHWARHNLRAPAMVEVKHAKDKALPFSAVKDHQRAWLLAGIGVDTKPYKISDESAGFKPCDLVLFGLMDAWVVVKYPKSFVVIDIEKFLEEEKQSDRKSLTEERAGEIANYVVKNK